MQFYSPLDQNNEQEFDSQEIQQAIHEPQVIRNTNLPPKVQNIQMNQISFKKDDLYSKDFSVPRLTTSRARSTSQRESIINEDNFKENFNKQQPQENYVNKPQYTTSSTSSHNPYRSIANQFNDLTNNYQSDIQGAIPQMNSFKRYRHDDQYEPYKRIKTSQSPSDTLQNIGYLAERPVQQNRQMIQKRTDDTQNYGLSNRDNNNSHQYNENNIIRNVQEPLKNFNEMKIQKHKVRMQKLGQELIEKEKFHNQEMVRCYSGLDPRATQLQTLGQQQIYLMKSFVNELEDLIKKYDNNKSSNNNSSIDFDGISSNSITMM